MNYVLRATTMHFSLILVIILSCKYAASEMEEGMCAPYRGKICKNYLDQQVWFQLSKENSGGWLNEQITKGLWEEMISGLREPCRSAAEVRLHFMLF